MNESRVRACVRVWVRGCSERAYTNKRAEIWHDDFAVNPRVQTMLAMIRVYLHITLDDRQAPFTAVHVNSWRWQTAENLCQTICPRITPPPLAACLPPQPLAGKS